MVVHAHTHAHACMHTCTCMYAHTHACTRTHTHTHMPAVKSTMKSKFQNLSQQCSIIPPHTAMQIGKISKVIAQRGGKKHHYYTINCFYTQTHSTRQRPHPPHPPPPSPPSPPPLKKTAVSEVGEKNNFHCFDRG